MAEGSGMWRREDGGFKKGKLQHFGECDFEEDPLQAVRIKRHKKGNIHLKWHSNIAANVARLVLYITKR